MHWKGFRNLCFFYGVWLTAAFIFPVAISCAVFLKSFFLVYVIAAYYCYRFLFPAKQWDWMRGTLCADDEPYCRTAQIVLAKGAKVPKPRERVLTTVAPHGILTLGWSYLISSKLYRNTEHKFLVAPAMMNLPFIGDIMRWTRCFSCDSKSMSRFMKNGDNIGLIPGGFQEASLYTRGLHRVYLNDRKGFVKYALKYGYSIQPTYVFGEELTFWTMDLLPTSIAFQLNKWHIPTCIFVGKYFSFMPEWDMDFTIVIGPDVKLPHIENPTTEQVDKYHAQFITAYRELFESNKEKYAATGKEAVLEIL